MQTGRRVGRALTALIALGFGALLLAGVAAAWLQRTNASNNASVEHTLQVQARIGDFAMFLERLETGRRGYLLSPDQSFRATFEEASMVLPVQLDGLARLTADNPEQQRILGRMRVLLARQLGVQRATIETARAGGEALEGDGSFAGDPAVALLRQNRALAGQLLANERSLLDERTRTQARSLAAINIVLGAAGLLILVVAGVTFGVLRRYTRDLRAQGEQLRVLNDDLEALVANRTAELQQANEEIQRFAYIVSHDLRSPLVNVMGFTAELDAARAAIGKAFDGLDGVPADARLAVDEDLPEAIGFIRTSTAKMDRLINAILRLSREGRRTLAPERLDMDALIAGVVDTLHQRAADAEVAIEPAHVPELTSDRIAVEQILSNLIENAIKYTSPDRPGLVRVEGWRERDRVFVAVIDNGRGIDPRDHQRIFDLFRRSGQQDRPGEGIGLAHVRSLAYRLGGIIEVESALDRGSTFRLSLPLTLEGEMRDD